MTGREIGSLVAAIVATAGALYGVFQWGKDVGSYSAKEVVDRSQARRVTLYGYFNDIDQKQSSYTATDTLKLTISPTKEAVRVEIVEGYSSGKIVSEQGQKVRKTWGLYGFIVGDRFVVSYYTSSPQAQSSGTYSLRQKGSNYVGYWMGRDNITGNTILAPYVVLTEQISVTEAKNKYPELSEPPRFLEKSAMQQRR